MYICICKKVTDRQIAAAVQHGAATMQSLCARLGVASQCGKCGPSTKVLLKQYQQKSSTE